MIKATTNENKNAMKFLKKAALLPIYFDSKVNVKTPTIVRVDTNAATWLYPAWLLSKVFAVEKATNVGMTVIEPIVEDKKIPNIPEFFPIIEDIVSVSNKDKTIPTIIIIEINWGIILSNDLNAILMAFLVLFLSFIKDTIIKDIEIP